MLIQLRLDPGCLGGRRDQYPGRCGLLYFASSTVVTSTITGTGITQFGHIVIPNECITYGNAWLNLDYVNFKPAGASGFDIVSGGAWNIGQFYNVPASGLTNLGGDLYTVNYYGGAGHHDFVLLSM